MIDPATGLMIANTAAGIFGSGGPDKPRPMDPIPEYLKDIYKQQGLSNYQDLGNLQDRQYYPGNHTANINKRLDTSLNQMSDYANNFGGKVKNNQYGAGLRGLKGLDNGLNFTNQLAQQGPNQFGYDQNTFNTTMNNLMPGLQESYNAATRGNNEQLNWSTLPGLQMGGVGANIQGGTKLGQAGALAQSNTDNLNRSIGASMWQNAANQAQQAGMQGGALNLSSQNQFGTDIMQGYGSIANQGLPQLANANNTAKGNIGLKNAAGQYEQQHNQNRIDNKTRAYMYNQDAPYNDLQARFNMQNAGLPGGQGGPGVPGMSRWEGGIQGFQNGMGMVNAYNDIWGSGYAAPANIYQPDETAGVDWNTFQ